MKRGPLKVFYSYAHEDERARDLLDEHLELLARRHLVVRWHDRHILPGSEWNASIDEALDSADIILLLISDAFMASDFVRTHEIPAAMREHDAGRAVVVPVLLENVKGWEHAPFARVQALPGRGRAVSEWRDPVAAYADIARGIERVAKKIIIAGGGPFEFGAHVFTDAELSALRPRERQRCAAGLARLGAALDTDIPPRRYERNLLIANWPLRKFGAQARSAQLPETLFYMAKVISAFDLVALQEVDRNLARLEALMQILGPDWSYLVTEVAPGNWGNNERFAIVHYRPRVEFRHFSSNLIVPPEPGADDGDRRAEQLARPPLLAAFRAGNWDFQVCTTHIVWGAGGQHGAAVARRLREVSAVASHLRRRTREAQTDLLLMGDMQLEKPGSAIHEALLEAGVQLPEAVLLPAHVTPERWYGLVGFVSAQRHMPLAGGPEPAGVVRLYDHVLRDADLDTFARTAAYRATRAASSATAADARLRHYRQWRTRQISDHLPLWVELQPPAA